MRSRPVQRARRSAAGAAAALAALATSAALAACSSELNQPAAPGDPPDIRGEDDLPDPFAGAYNAEFRSNLDAYVGQEVTVEAIVDEVLTPGTFTITSPLGEDVDPALVVTEQDVDLAAGQAVVVAATPFEGLELGAIEAQLDTDLPDDAFADYEGEVYLNAEVVEPVIE